MVNINNNINNNNNNNNDNNINAVDQNSQNTVTNTNAANQISVTVLPIPGKRSFRKLRSAPCFYRERESDIEESVANLLFSHMFPVNSMQDSKDDPCNPYKFCKEMKNVLDIFELDNVVLVNLLTFGINPKLTELSCKELFPNCG